MNEQIQLARRYVRMVWPYRWAALALSIVVSLAGWMYAITLPNIYQVDAKIFIDTYSILRPLLKGLAVENDSLASSASLMQRTLLTRPNLEEVARKTDLDLEAKTAKDFDLVVEKLAENISLSGTSDDNIYQISFENSDPQRAKRVVDELLNSFLETALGSNRKDTAETQKFLDEQIQEYEKRLIAAEQRLKEFKQRNAGQMPSEGGNYFKSLQDARGILKSARMEYDEARNRSVELHRQVDAGARETTTGPVAEIPLVTPFDDRMARLQEQLDQLLSQYTEKHPDVAGLRSQLEALKVQREKALKEIATSSVATGELPAGAQGNSPFMEIRLAIAQADAEVSALQARVKFYEQEVSELEKQVDTIPEIEAELKRLDRDYGLNKQQFDELLKRRESARISQQVDQRADDIKIKVIEPPRIPLSPIGPNRVQLMSIILAASLGAGAGLAFLLSQINPRFYSSDELKEIARLPVIGTVSLVFSQRQRTERRMEMAVFGLVVFGLVGLYGALVGLELMQFDLNGRIMSLMGRAT